MTQRRTRLALARAAEPTGAALAALGTAIHCLGRLTDLTHQGPGPAHDRARAVAQKQLIDCLGESRTHLARAAKRLRDAADTRAAPATLAPIPPTASAARTR